MNDNQMYDNQMNDNQMYDNQMNDNQMNDNQMNDNAYRGNIANHLEIGRIHVYDCNADFTRVFLFFIYFLGFLLII